MKAKLGFFYLVLTGFIFAYMFTPKVMSQYYFLWVIIVISLCLIVFLAFPDKDILLRKRFLKHSNLFILSIIIVYFQYPIDYILGNSLPNDDFIWVKEAVASKALIMSSIGLISFFIGYLLFSPLAKSVININVVQTKHNFFALKVIALLSLITYFYTVNPLYIAGGYGIVQEGATATYAAVIFNACVVAIIVQCSRNIIISKTKEITFLSYLKKIGYFTAILVIIYLLSVMYSGDRGPIIVIALVIIGGYLNVSLKRYSFSFILSLVLIASFSISLLGIARSFDRDMSFKERIMIAYSDGSNRTSNTISPTTQELAISINTFHHVVNYIPEEHGYLLGSLQLNQLVYTIPFISGIYHSFWSEEDLRKYAGIATFITWIIQGDYPNYGNGASILADFYVAAGLVGIVLGMLLTGWLIRRSEYVMYSGILPPLFWHVFSIIYFSNMIYLGRSSLFEGLKLVVMVIILIYINKYFSIKSHITTKV